MNWTKKLLISLGIAGFVVCCGAVLLFNWSVFGWRAMSVPTGSMRPAIPPGSLVLVHSVPNSSLKVGDVITYANLQKPGTTITHRIIKSYKLDGKVPAYITKGDANPSADPINVVGGQVQGKEVWHIPHIGSWLGWSKTWVGLAILVWVPALLIMFGEAQKMADYLRKFQVYKLQDNPKIRRHLGKKPAAAALSVIILFIFGAAALPAHALLQTNTVSLVNNRLSVAPIAHQCVSNSTNINVSNSSSSNNSNNVTVTNNNSQTATSGSASSSNNTNGGNATSGNAANTNCTSTTITIH